MSTNPSFDTEVAIIGYGPTGLSAALALGHYGVKAIAFERDADVYPRARAVTVNDWTMRCFQSLGLDEDLARVMDPTVALRWINYDKQELTRLEFPPSRLGRHPQSYAIYQPDMEKTLRRAADKHSGHVQVRYGVEVTGVEQDAEGVTVFTRTLADGKTASVRASYVLACDGGSSATREQLGIKLEGETRAIKWVVIDGRVKRWWPDRHILTFWSDKQRPVVDIALALGHHRWEFPLQEHESEDDFSTEEQLWKLLYTLGVTKDDVDIHRVGPVDQHAFYRHHMRFAERWRAGRVFLLGDAGHLMPPWAGSGMQSGIRDAFNITWKLREVLAGRLPDALLDSYQAEREPNVRFYTHVAVELGRIIQQQLSAEEMAALAPKPGEPPPEPPLLKNPWYDAGWLRGPTDPSSAVGKMIPQPYVANAQGKLCWLDELLGNGFALLGDGVDPATELSAEQKTQWDRLNTRYLAVLASEQRGHGHDDVIDLHGHLLRWMRQHDAKVIAVRPDRFVACASPSGLAVPGA
jgi:3-(3-hydroxy-phenyl)propionate hydroxylase